MRQSDRNLKQARSLPARVGTAVGLLIAFGLLLAVPASAGFEQVGIFADKGEGEKLLYTGGMAVNTTGAGGVPAGTIYTVAQAGVYRYSAEGEFREGWGWGVGDGKEEFQRCGPDGEPAHPICDERGSDGEGVGQLSDNPKGVAVDQTTGNVYVFNEVNPQRQHNLIQVFNADGSQLIAVFGDAGPESESFDEGPEKIHAAKMANSIAVDASGTVYVADYRGTSYFENRIMVFEPESPGDYENYAYTGRARDITTTHAAGQAVLDYAGNVYAAGGEFIFQFAPGEPDAPTCEYTTPAGGIQGMTVNPVSGEVFYFTYKDKRIHQLSACNPQGEFVETTSFAPTPKTQNMQVLALNPAVAWEGSRPLGILYGASTDENVSKKGLGYIFAPAEIRSPVVESESVSSVTSSTATLGARVNPKGSPTRYVFQYITEAAYQANEAADRFAGAIEAPLGGAVLGSGQAVLGAAASLVGLMPDTAYRYRVLATSHCNPDDEEEVCEAIGADQAFHTFPAEAPGLPDGRAYELVSPAQKAAGQVFPAAPNIASCGSECKPVLPSDRFPMQSAPDGEAVAYEGFPFSNTDGAVRFNEYVSRRTASGWQTTILSPVLQSSGSKQGYRAFNAELTRGLLYQVAPSLSPDAPSGYANLYSQPTASPSTLSPLLVAEPPNRPAGLSFVLTYAGASADFSRFFFEANDALTEETPFAPAAEDGGAGKNNLYEWAGGQLRLVNVSPGNAAAVPGASFGSGTQISAANTANFSHAISSDGSRVFWSSEGGQAYVREDGASTRAIPDPGKFLSASADGSKVLLDNGHLYDLETEAITDLGEGQGGFQGIVGQSEDLSSIYFVDTAVLSGEEENDHGAKAQAGKDNLYAWHEGTSVFVATLLPTDDLNPGDTNTVEGDWHASPVQRTAQASPDGRWVAFQSRAPLTGYDNVGPSCIPNGSGAGELFFPGACVEVFLYDSATGKLSCPSCNPSGARPLGSSHLRLISEAPGSLPQPRYLTDSGRLLFDSRDSLTPFDTNDGVEDVYEYEPDGIGSCKREAGCVNLISAGSEPVDSNFLAMDETGKNVFFTTRDQLALKDRDDLIDLYVAREGGGIASETETGRSECQGEACQAAITPPNDPTPGSSTFEGAGNVDEKKVTKKHKKKRKHAKKQKSHKRSHGRANNNRGGAK